MTKARVEVLADGLAFPEGPAFSPRGELWFVEIEAGNIVRLEDGRLDRIHTGGVPNGMTFDAAGRAWFCDREHHVIRAYDPAADEWDTMCETASGRTLSKPNDLAFDVAGNLVFTCPNYTPTDPAGSVV
ncbi:MAG TPA: SMP-30/gluconolactonase/LRE family protein, partial [Polyangia bacterium]|nr:SMP-30/gluconolactonase/LRE family protein [Polyangia bacterium]